MPAGAAQLCERCRGAANPGRQDSNVGWGLAAALLDQHAWVHRRSDVLFLSDADGGTRETWIDCTPPTDPDLSYPFDQSATNQLAVPLAVLVKDPSPGFSVVTSGGQRLPTLGAVESAQAGAALLLVVGRLAGAVVDADGAARAFSAIARAQPDCATEAAGRLLLDGLWDGRRVIDPERWRKLPVLGWLLPDLASGALLLAVLDRSEAGTRQILGIRSGFAFGDSAAGSVAQYLGLRSAVVEVDLAGHADAATYSLEVHAPPGVISNGVLMPGAERYQVPQIGDRSDHLGRPPGPTASAGPAATIARAEGAYPVGSPSAPARVLLSPSRHGLVPVTTLMCSMTTLVLWLTLLVPGGLDALAAAANGSATLLLAGSAAVLALLVRPGESSTASRLLVGMRAILICCSVSLGLATESLVGRLREPWLRLLWLTLGTFTLLLAIGSVCGWLAVRRRT